MKTRGLIPWGPGEPESLSPVPGDTGKPGTRALGMWTLLPGSNCASSKGGAESVSDLKLGLARESVSLPTYLHLLYL